MKEELSLWKLKIPFLHFQKTILNVLFGGCKLVFLATIKNYTPKEQISEKMHTAEKRVKSFGLNKN